MVLHSNKVGYGIRLQLTCHEKDVHQKSADREYILEPTDHSYNTTYRSYLPCLVHTKDINLGKYIHSSYLLTYLYKSVIFQVLFIQLHKLSY